MPFENFEDKKNIARRSSSNTKSALTKKPGFKSTTLRY